MNISPGGKTPAGPIHLPTVFPPFRKGEICPVTDGCPVFVLFRVSSAFGAFGLRLVRLGFVCVWCAFAFRVRLVCVWCVFVLCAFRGFFFARLRFCVRLSRLFFVVSVFARSRWRSGLAIRTATA